ncbi:MAG TPA: nucleotidyltransferase domain-containing protein [Candidatus Sulfopaludibacter sp.]|nr:nucleotidyltransferase domain-containing protein [Candidatus Sulfopaludibacter sp.]
MDKVLDQLVERLRKAFGERLVSVFLYGSAATGEHSARFSDYNILCVLDEITPRELAAAGEVFRWWREKSSPAPLLLTEWELAASTDCFAIEFLDIQQNHKLLYGRNVIGPLEVDRSFYRAQVEHDLRGKLLRLRQKSCGMFHDADLLRRLLLDSVPTFCVLFRHALALSGAEAPVRKRETILQASRQFGFDPLPFERLLDVREEHIKAREIEPAALLGAYLDGISRVIGAVDRLEK